MYFVLKSEQTETVNLTRDVLSPALLTTIAWWGGALGADPVFCAAGQDLVRFSEQVCLEKWDSLLLQLSNSSSGSIYLRFVFLIPIVPSCRRTRSFVDGELLIRFGRTDRPLASGGESQKFVDAETLWPITAEPFAVSW